MAVAHLKQVDEETYGMVGVAAVRTCTRNGFLRSEMIDGRRHLLLRATAADLIRLRFTWFDHYTLLRQIGGHGHNLNRLSGICRSGVHDPANQETVFLL